MPHILVKMVEGRSNAIKRELADHLTAALSDVLALDVSAISVAVEDIPAQRWMEQVYLPDIVGAEQCLVKRPGYGPLAKPMSSEDQ